MSNKQLKSVTVFCGSSMGVDPAFEKAAYQMGVQLAASGLRLVYGGAKVGLMGAVANGALDGGAEVIGVIPRFLSNVELAHKGLTELIVVESMHERKAKMAERSDGFIALPGGFGTLEEVFEILTWGQLALHQKPVGLLNTLGFYDHLLALLDHMVDQGLLKKVNKDMLLVDSSIERLLEKMRSYQPPTEGKWLGGVEKLS